MKSGHAAKSKNLLAWNGIDCLLAPEQGACLERNGVPACSGMGCLLGADSTILSKHTLKYVINMPGELFQPNASTHTAIAVFETNSPHNNKKVVLLSLNDDGFILSKHRGRTDVLNKWTGIKKEMLEKLKKPQQNQDNINLVYTKIGEDDEWIIQAHSKTDYSKLSQKDFSNSIKEYVIFSTKMKLNLIDKDIDEITLLEILNDNLISATDTLEDGNNGK